MYRVQDVVCGQLPSRVQNSMGFLRVEQVRESPE